MEDIIKSDTELPAMYEKNQEKLRREASKLKD